MQIYADRDLMLGGLLASESFAFGTQARARMKMIAATAIPTALLTVLYKYGGRQLDRKEFYLPAGFPYEIDNPYIESSYGGHRYVFRPQTAKVSGTLPAAGDTATVNYDVALDLYRNTLYIANVDGITVTTEQENTVGVIE